MKNLSIGVEGYGRRGKVLLNRLVCVPGIDSIYVHDINDSKKLEIEQYSPKVRWVDSYKDSLEKVDGMIIATSPSSHFQLAKLALEHSKDLLLEKPSTLYYKDDCELEKISKSKGRFVSVGLSERFNEVVERARKNIDFSDVDLCFSLRRNWPEEKGEDPGLERDLILHDLDLDILFFGKVPEILSIKSLKDRSYLHLLFGNADAELNARLIENTKYRYRGALFFGTEKYYFLDYAAQEFHESRGLIIPEEWRKQFYKVDYPLLLHMTRPIETKIPSIDEPVPKMLNCFISSIRADEILEPMCSISESKIRTQVIEEALKYKTSSQL